MTNAETEKNNENALGSAEMVDRGIFEDLQQMFKDPFGQDSPQKSPPKSLSISPPKVTSLNGLNCNNPFHFQDPSMIYLRGQPPYSYDTADGRNIVLGMIDQIAPEIELQFHLHMPLYPQDSTEMRTNLLHFGHNNINRFPAVWIWNNTEFRVNWREPNKNKVVKMKDFLRPCGSYYVKIMINSAQILVKVIDKLTGIESQAQQNLGFTPTAWTDVPAFASYAHPDSSNIDVFTQRPLNAYIAKIKMFLLACSSDIDDSTSDSPFLTADHDYQCVAYDRPEDANCVNPYKFRASDQKLWNEGDNIDLGVVERIAPEEGEGMSLDFFLHMPASPRDSTGKITNLLHFGADNLWKYPSIWLSDNTDLKITHKLLHETEQTVLWMHDVFESCGSYHIMIDFTSTVMTVEIRTGARVLSNSTTFNYELPAMRRVPVYASYQGGDHEGTETNKALNAYGVVSKMCHELAKTTFFPPKRPRVTCSA